MDILIAEDEKRLAEAIRFLLEREGHHVDVVYDGKSALDYIQARNEYDLFIFDIMMPQMSGLEVLAALRKQSVETPVLMLTALAETSDKVTGLDAGADDYLTKPFQPEEFLARVRALTRRKGQVLIDQATFADLVLDLNSHSLACAINGKAHEVRLSEKEFEVLSLLMRNEGRVLSKEQLITKVWGYNSYVEDNNVEAYISFLRKKLRHVHSCVTIETVRGVGYMLTSPDREG